MNLFPFAVLWLILVIALIVVALYRQIIVRGEVDLLHFQEGQEKKIEEQVARASKVQVIDRYCKILGIVLTIYSVLLGAAYIYSALISSSVRTS